MQSIATSAGLRMEQGVIGYSSPEEVARRMFDHLYLRNVSSSSAGSGSGSGSGDAQSPRSAAAIAPRLDTVVVFTDEFHYELWYNETALLNYHRNGLNPLLTLYQADGRMLSVQVAVDAALIAYHHSSAMPPSASSQSGGSGRLELEVDAAAVSFPQCIRHRAYETRLPPLVLVLGPGERCGAVRREGRRRERA